MEHGKVSPVLEAPANVEYQFNGFVRERLIASIEQWLLPAPLANPGMIQMFRDRDREPRRSLVPWAGEFVGKYLTSAVQTYRVTGHPRLRDRINEVVRQLSEVQDKDGYLGPYPMSERLTGRSIHKDLNGWPLWDVWGHYHCMLGLLLWHRETGDEAALSTCLKAADYICGRFLETGQRTILAGAEEMNLAVAHGFCLLYEVTGNERYLHMAQEIEKDWETPPAGDYVRTALEGKEFWETPKPRWESLHDIQAVAELYFITGKQKYRQAFEHTWWSIVKGDRHNSGGFSSGEKATGNPYDPGAIETCCTIAWMALTVDMLRMTGDSKAADELELSTFNGMLGAQAPLGRWWTYNTPMDGFREASAHAIVFQAYRGTPELNCCSVNGPRGLGLLGEWAVMRAENGVALNYYGPVSIRIPLRSGGTLQLTEETTYPKDGKVKILVEPSRHIPLALRLRIPYWSAETEVRVNGKRIGDPAPGTYLVLERTWENGDVINLTLDMSFHVWAGERECDGKASIYRGPILLAYDQRYNPMDPDDVPTLDAKNLEGSSVKWTEWPVPLTLFEFRANSGQKVILCDFASAGAAGTIYRSWLSVEGVKPLSFSVENPLRSARAECSARRD